MKIAQIVTCNQLCPKIVQVNSVTSALLRISRVKTLQCAEAHNEATRDRKSWNIVAAASLANYKQQNHEHEENPRVDISRNCLYFINQTFLRLNSILSKKKV